VKPWTSIFLTIVLAACTKPAPPQPPPPPQRIHPFRFLALGDSYTIGESVDDSQRWPVQLVTAMRNAGVDVGSPTLIAQTGWTTANLLTAIDNTNPQGPFDVVGLLIGVNNLYQGRSEDEYRIQFVQLLHRSIDLAGDKPSHVIVLSIPDWGTTPYAKRIGANAATVAAAIDRFNVVAKSEAAKVGAAYVDITAITRSHPDLVADDGLHPSGEMYAEWVKLALPPALSAVLK